MTINIWYAVVAAFVSLFTGFRIGRSMKWMAEETEERIKENKDIIRNSAAPGEWMIASPVSGLMTTFYENGKCGVAIQAEQECIYAPASGKIAKLYPMGNSMLISTDFGVDVLVSVGRGADEMCSMFYRPRVVQNEVIVKGRLLLEFDRESLEKESVDTTVHVTVEQLQGDKVPVVAPTERVNVGEALIWV